nr:hypothetical protein [Tanacetum cinerariifolium]
MFDSQDLFPSKEISPKDIETLVKSSIPMAPKRTSTSATPTMTEATIRQLITKGVAAALEVQAAAMANGDNPNRNTRPREIPVVKEETIKSSSTVNLSTLMVRKELLDLFAGLNEL